MPGTGGRTAMKFVGLLKFRRKVDRDLVDWTVKMIRADEKEGIRFLTIVWTLGRYDAVALYEAPDEKAAMKLSIERGEYMEIETLVAVPVEEARELVE
jgi:uncharacterized protein with GYD domain